MRQAIAAALFTLASCVAQTRSAPDPSTDPDAPRASAIAYDNTLSQLLSTSVQDAIDDVAIAGARERERLDIVEARGTPIFCRRTVANQALLLGVNEIAFAFTAGDCGGALPGIDHVGALARFRTCSPSFEWIIVTNADDPGGPGIRFRRDDSSFCAGPADLAAVFTKVR